MARLFFAALVAAGVAAAAQSFSGGANTLELVLLDRAKYPLAVCNDGSMAGYYFRKGTSNMFIVHQEGGGWCYDAKSCQGRPSSLTGSGGWAQTKTPVTGSLLAPSDATLAAASR